MLIPTSVTGICGWGIPSKWFERLTEKYFPNSKINIIYPKNPFDSNEAENYLLHDESELIFGYSLGSLWLLHYKHFLYSNKWKALLAPILGFAKERGLGGKIPSIKLNFMLQLLRKSTNDKTILRDFYKVSDLDIPESFHMRGIEKKHLISGLEFLNTVQEDPIKALEFITFVGENDSLLEGSEIKFHLPQTEIIYQAGHAPEALIMGLSQKFK